MKPSQTTLRSVNEKEELQAQKAYYERVQAEIMKTENVPFISRQMVETKIEKAKATKGGVSGDLPAKLMKEFSTELAPPLSALFRNVAATGKWPERWKLEQGLPLKKKNDPLTQDDLRILRFA